MTRVDDDGARREERFERLYRERYVDISGYVRRRVPGPDATEVIAQVFVVAWRRFEHIPSPPEDRLWLFGVARRAVADHDRSLIRRLRLHERLAAQPAPNAPAEFIDPLRARVDSAIGHLRPKDREVLRLVLWDDLSHAEAARVLGCSPNAAELRFRRALARVRDALAISSPSASSDAVPFRHWRTQP